MRLDRRTWPEVLAAHASQQEVLLQLAERAYRLCKAATPTAASVRAVMGLNPSAEAVPLVPEADALIEKPALGMSSLPWYMTEINKMVPGTFNRQQLREGVFWWFQVALPSPDAG